MVPDFWVYGSYTSDLFWTIKVHIPVTYDVILLAHGQLEILGSKSGSVAE